MHPPPTGGWAIKGEKNDRYTAITDTKVEADKIGREIAKNQQGEFIIHGKDGKIQDKDSCIIPYLSSSQLVRHEPLLPNLRFD